MAREETCCHLMGYSIQLTARVLLYAPSHGQDSTYHDLISQPWSSGWNKKYCDRLGGKWLRFCYKWFNVFEVSDPAHPLNISFLVTRSVYITPSHTKKLKNQLKEFIKKYHLNRDNFLFQGKLENKTIKEDRLHACTWRYIWMSF